MCSQQACNKLVNKFVAILLFYQVVPSLLLTTCWQVVDLQPDNKLLEQLVANKAVEFIKLVASLLQACGNLSASWDQAVRINVATSLSQQGSQRERSLFMAGGGGNEEKYFRSQIFPNNPTIKNKYFSPLNHSSHSKILDQPLL